MACSIVQSIASTECVGNSLVKINGNFSALETAVCELQNSSNIPVGGIIMYSGSLSNFTLGVGTTPDLINFALCDGTNGTPDLRDRFVLGSTTTIAVSGGSSTTTLTIDQIPPHQHSQDGNNAWGVGTGSGNGSPALRQGYGGSTGWTGGGQPFSIMPPYLKLAYIMRIV